MSAGVGDFRRRQGVSPEVQRRVLKQQREGALHVLGRHHPQLVRVDLTTDPLAPTVSWTAASWLDGAHLAVLTPSGGEWFAGLSAAGVLRYRIGGGCV